MLPTSAHFDFTTNAFAIKALFATPIVVLGAAAAIHSIGYLRASPNSATRGGASGGIYGAASVSAGVRDAASFAATRVATAKLAFYWIAFAAMIASMLGVVFLSGKIPFLLAWELMGLSSAALVAFDANSQQAQRAAWIYFAACNLGAACLMLAFFAAASPAAILVLLTLGFGLKAGFAGLHAWLPEAHPAAPAPVSALMSGAMINLGFCGFIKFAPLADGFMRFAVPVGSSFVAIGIATALFGVVSALRQRNLKRLLAFSSIENMGILALALGLAVLASAHVKIYIVHFAATGFALHVINHALLKGGLFLCAGSIYKTVHTLDLDKMGGLLKRMPATGSAFIFNGFGLAGLPPLGAFIGEFFIYMAAFQLVISAKGAMFCAGLASVAAMALCGGLASVVYAKAIAAAFLGEPRTKEAAQARETPASMRLPIMALAALHFISIPVLWEPVCRMFSFATKFYDRLLFAYSAAAVLLGVALLLRFKLLPRASQNPRLPTWDCGYDAPDARMQYTATAISQPLADYFPDATRQKKSSSDARPLFMDEADAAALMNGDSAAPRAPRPAAVFLAGIARRIRPARYATLHSFVLAMVLALVALFAWAMLA